MKERLHEFLDNIISDLVEYDLSYHLQDLDYFDDIEITQYQDKYYGQDLLSFGIYGKIKYAEDVFLTSFTIRMTDVTLEFDNNVQNVIDYVIKPLKEYNKKLKKEYNSKEIDSEPEFVGSNNDYE